MKDNDELAFAVAPNCPVDLVPMELSSPTEWPAWECPDCGLHRTPDESKSGWRTTLNLPSRGRQPLLLVEDVTGEVSVWHDSRSRLNGPMATWPEAEHAARTWLTANP